ncbi:hypothetical protein D3C71_2151480 [compost metagenome]
MTRYPVPPGAAYVVRPPSQHPTRKVRVLTEMLAEYFKRNPELWGVDPRQEPAFDSAL